MNTDRGRRAAGCRATITGSFTFGIAGPRAFQPKKKHHTTLGLRPLVLAATEENTFGTMIHTYHSQGSSVSDGQSGRVARERGEM